MPLNHPLFPPLMRFFHPLVKFLPPQLQILYRMIISPRPLNHHLPSPFKKFRNLLVQLLLRLLKILLPPPSDAIPTASHSFPAALEPIPATTHSEVPPIATLQEEMNSTIIYSQLDDSQVRVSNKDTPHPSPPDMTQPATSPSSPTSVTSICHPVVVPVVSPIDVGKDLEVPHSPSAVTGISTAGPAARTCSHSRTPLPLLQLPWQFRM
jgi:hypothetical protein